MGGSVIGGSTVRTINRSFDRASVRGAVILEGRGRKFFAR